MQSCESRHHKVLILSKVFNHSFPTFVGFHEYFGYTRVINFQDTLQMDNRKKMAERRRFHSYAPFVELLGKSQNFTKINKPEKILLKDLPKY